MKSVAEKANLSQSPRRKQQGMEMETPQGAGSMPSYRQEQDFKQMGACLAERPLQTGLQQSGCPGDHPVLINYVHTTSHITCFPK